MSVKLLAEHHLEFLSLKGGCTGSSESTLVKCLIVGNYESRLLIKMRHNISTETRADGGHALVQGVAYYSHLLGYILSLEH